MTDSRGDDSANAGTSFDIDTVFSMLAPVVEFVNPYIDAVVEATPEARVHLFASARELCLAAEVFLGALEDAARSASSSVAESGPSVVVVPDAPSGGDATSSPGPDVRSA